MMARGVPVGASTAYQELTSYPGKVSAIDGASGNSDTRFALLTASRRTCFCLM